jgi:hypothetical protein
MNLDVKSKWLKALRSGEYRQTTSCLRRGDGFCCLGVLTDLAIKEGVLPDWKMYDPFATPDIFYVEDVDAHMVMDQQDAVLPATVMEWANLSSRDGTTGLDGTSLAQLNDSGASFDELAEIIEERF